MIRKVIISIDSLVELFRDFFPDGDIPDDAKAVTLMVNPSERGMFAIQMESDEWNGSEAPLRASFDIKKVYAV